MKFRSAPHSKMKSELVPNMLQNPRCGVKGKFRRNRSTANGTKRKPSHSLIKVIVVEITLSEFEPFLCGVSNASGFAKARR